MVELQGHTENIKGCKPTARYQKYFDKTNKLYFEGKLPKVKVYTAPLLKITQLSQKSALDSRNWKHAGNYAICGYDEFGEPSVILDKGTSIFHSLITRQSILHEQIHWYLGLNVGHGKIFKAQIRRIAALGALDNLI